GEHTPGHDADEPAAASRAGRRDRVSRAVRADLPVGGEPGEWARGNNRLGAQAQRRRGEMGPQRIFGMTPWVRRLFVANLVVFLFQMTIFVDPRFLSTFGFVPLRGLAQPLPFVSNLVL